MTKFSLRQEATSKGSVAGKPNEDGYIVLPEVMTLIDGATGRAKDDRRFIADTQDGSDARWLVDETIQMIQQTPDAHKDHPDIRHYIRSLAAGLSTTFRQSATPYPDATPAEYPRAAMSLARIHNGILEIDGLSDVETLVVFTDGTFDHIPGDTRTKFESDHHTAHLGQLMKQALSPEELDRAFKKFLLGRPLPNTAGQRGAFGISLDEKTSPLPSNDSFIGRWRHAAADVAQVIMWTDGIDRRCDKITLGELIHATDYARGFEPIIKRIRDAEESDPDFTKYPRTKMHDDATIIAVDLDP